MKLQVMPIYGWGWTNSKGDPIDVPPSFELDVTVLEAGEPFRLALGHFQDDHRNALSGLWILLSQRHVINDGHYNLEAFDEKPSLPRIAGPTALIRPLLMGFASASLIST